MLRVNGIQSSLYASFEGCQHQSAANQQLPKSVDSLHKTCNGVTPDLISTPPYQKKIAVWPHKTSLANLHASRRTV